MSAPTPATNASEEVGHAVGAAGLPSTRGRPRDLLFLLPAFLLIPFLFVTATFEEANLANLFQAVSTSGLVFVPMLALTAAWRGRFRPRMALEAVGLYLAYDALSVREIAYALARPHVPIGGNPNWITVAVILGAAAILVVATLRRATMFRVVALLVSLAQITTLVVFHQLTVIKPIDVARAAETRLVADLVAAHAGTPEGPTGGLRVLCGIDGRLCFEEDPIALADRLEREMPASDSTVRLLRDTADDGSLVFTFTEAAFAATADEAMRHISLVKDTPGHAFVMLNQKGPTLAFSQMKLAFSWLAVLFQQAWVTMALLILWRHGDFELVRGRWRRSDGADRPASA